MDNPDGIPVAWLRFPPEMEAAFEAVRLREQEEIRVRNEEMLRGRTPSECGLMFASDGRLVPFP